MTTKVKAWGLSDILIQLGWGEWDIFYNYTWLHSQWDRVVGDHTAQYSRICPDQMHGYHHNEFSGSSILGDSYSKNLFLLKIPLSGNIINCYEKFMFRPWSVLFYSLIDLSFVRKHTLKIQILAIYTHFKSVLPLLWLTKC